MRSVLQDADETRPGDAAQATQARPPIHIELPASRSAQPTRVSAWVDGEEIWFESEAETVPLVSRAEAWVSAFWLISLLSRRTLQIEAPLDATFLGNLRKVTSIYHAWWQADTLVAEKNLQLLGANAIDLAESADGPVAQCFSCGADSFYSLLRENHPSKYLVYVHGFDIPCSERYRMRKHRQSLEAVARATGKQLIVLKTNLREHTTFRQRHWDETHGPALACVGHLLSSRVRQLIIPSSHPYYDPRPNGSHWSTDGLYSSRDLEVKHDDATHYRLDKLKRMADEPLVQHHLKVCFAHYSMSGNCSRCDKCIRTMIALDQVGQLKNYTVFDQRRELVDVMHRADPIDESLHCYYDPLREQGLSPELEAAITCMLGRRRRTWTRRVERGLLRLAGRWLR